jgi:hypothetical protein
MAVFKSRLNFHGIDDLLGQTIVSSISYYDFINGTISESAKGDFPIVYRSSVYCKGLSKIDSKLTARKNGVLHVFSHVQMEK